MRKSSKEKWSGPVCCLITKPLKSTLARTAYSLRNKSVSIWKNSLKPTRKKWWTHYQLINKGSSNVKTPFNPWVSFARLASSSERQSAIASFKILIWRKGNRFRRIRKKKRTLFLIRVKVKIRSHFLYQRKIRKKSWLKNFTTIYSEVKLVSS